MQQSVSDALGETPQPAAIGPASEPAAIGNVAPDCHGQNFYRIDPAFRALLAHYMPADLHAHLAPHFDRVGEIAGGRLDALSRVADRHGPILHPRDAFGRDRDWIEYHPAYREMEKIAYDEIGFNRMANAPGVFGWPEKLGPLAKYAFTYLFVQGEFGLMCPISLSDTATFMVGRYAPDWLKAKVFPKMTAATREEMWTGAQFMTETGAGSDVGRIEVAARRDGDHWRVFGDKWFCSHADADVAVILARTEGSVAGTRGLSLFLVPRHLEDGERNAYRIVRLKDKMGTRSMASGEIRFEGAVAYLMGEEGQGLKHMMEQVNLSRLSHGVRAAAMMRRCLNEALMVARHRVQFGGPVGRFPLMRRQLMKIMLPTEQALSMTLHTPAVMERANAGDARAAKELRILTPVFKYRACRDNIPVATGSMEVRGGNGYIEDWVNARLVRDAQVGLLWEGTSNINALDVTQRAIGKVGAHEALRESLHEALDAAATVPGQFRGELAAVTDRAIDFAEAVAAGAETEDQARMAAKALYNATSAVLLAKDGHVMNEATGDARRLLLARLVVDHRLSPSDPLKVRETAFDRAAGDLLLGDEPAGIDEVARVLAL